MDAPKKVVLKRRRLELPPDTLIVEKKQRNDGEGRFAPATRYIRHKASKASIRNSNASHGHTGAAQQTLRPANERREFHLSQPATTSTPGESINKRKRKQDDDRIATVVESKRSKLRYDQISALPEENQIEFEQRPLSRSLKRPGRGTAKAVAQQDAASQSRPTTFVEGQIALEQQRLDALAEEMHKFALEEIAKTPKPELKSRPKMSAAQARARHQARKPATPEPKAAPQTDEMDTSSDNDYVFDTYILVSQPQDNTLEGNAQVVTSTNDDTGNVGYLVITSDEEKLWEEFIERDELEDSEPEDDDDENAEAYYGADYPSDELASDDEYDRGAYGYRQQHGSDDEQYDADTWRDEEDKQLMNPFGAKGKVSAQFAKYLSRDSKGAVDSDDEA